jgi:hypothetical protein
MKIDFDKPVKTKISLDKTLERFSKQKCEVINILDLQQEIRNINKEIVGLKNDMHHVKTNNHDLNRQLLMMNLQKTFQDEKLEDQG